MDHEKKEASGIAKAGLVTGIIGSALGVLDGGFLGLGRGGYGFRGHYGHEGAIDKDAYIAKLEAERYADNKLALVELQLCRQQNEITRLECELKCFQQKEERDVRDVYGWCDCKFVPQEKGYVNKARIIDCGDRGCITEGRRPYGDPREAYYEG